MPSLPLEEYWVLESSNSLHKYNKLPVWPVLPDYLSVLMTIFPYNRNIIILPGHMPAIYLQVYFYNITVMPTYSKNYSTRNTDNNINHETIFHS